MAINKDVYRKLKGELTAKKVILVAVSKTKSVEEIKELYDLGQRDFGENYVQELEEKYEKLPKDIRWHFIGHLQTNKIKQIAPFVQLIQSVDSLKVLKEINKQAERNNRVIDCLLQVHIAEEETKFGLNEEELNWLTGQFADEYMKNIRVSGLMGIASFTSDMNKVRKEFQNLKAIFNKTSELAINNWQMTILSMGMSGDYKIGMEEGSNMVRIGSLIFGERE